MMVGRGGSVVGGGTEGSRVCTGGISPGVGWFG
jgi:hypothetical protein